MMRSMFSGVSGLKVHQTRMDVTGNNISNVNTLGYKAQRVTFNEVFSQTLQGASSASDETGRGGRNAMQVGLGVNVSSIDMLMTQGAAQRTDNPFDVMINGSGFLVVGDANGQYFTRAGALRVDDDGNLCIQNGMRVKGWLAQPNANGKNEIVKSEVQNISLGSLSGSTSAASTTTKASLSGNINATSSKDEETTISFYDSLGNYYKAAVKFKKTTTNGQSTYTPELGKITDANGKELKGYTVGVTGTLSFDADGKLVTTTTGTGDAATTTGDSLKLTFTKATGADAPTANIGAAGTTAGAPSEIVVDCSKMTQYASKSTLKPEAVDGNAAGSMTGYAIGGDGTITASYSNGDTRVIAQVVVAEFDNPAGLEKVGDNLYNVTTNSGDFDGIGKVGDFSTSCLEMSNVDLSSEFTDMIITQRGFQANSRIITVSDEMLQELTNLKR